MFRDLKEYQEIAKIYAEKVSKPENLEERRGSSPEQLAQNRKNAFKPVTPPQGGAGGGVGNPTNVRGSGARNNRPKPEIKKFPSTAEIRAANPNAVGGGNAAGSTDSGGTSQSTIKSVEQKPDPKPMSTSDKFKSKFIKKDKGVGFVKRGTPGAQRAENKEKNKMRAQEMAKARIAAKKEGTASPQMSGADRAKAMAKARLAAKNKPTAQAKSDVSAGTPTRKETSSTTQSGNTTTTKTKVTSGTGGGTEGLTKSAGSLEANKKKAERLKAIAAKNAAMEKEFESKQFDAYDLVLEYLLYTEQAATIEEANYVMTEMDAETIQGIVEEQKKTLDEMDMMKMPVVNVLGGLAGAVGGTVAAAKYLGRKAGEKSIKKTEPKKPGLIKTIKDRTDATNKAIKGMDNP